MACRPKSWLWFQTPLRCNVVAAQSWLYYGYSWQPGSIAVIPISDACLCRINQTATDGQTRSVLVLLNALPTFQRQKPLDIFCKHTVRVIIMMRTACSQNIHTPLLGFFVENTLLILAEQCVIYSLDILQGHFTSTAVLIWLPKCQWSDPQRLV